MNRTVKVIILGLLTIIGFIFFGWLNRVAFFSELDWVARTVFFILAFMIGLGGWGLSAYFIEKRWVIYVISFVGLSALLFILPINLYYLGSLAIIFFTSIFALERILTDKHGRARVMLYESTAAGLKSLLVVCCLLVALNFYYSPLSQIHKVNVPVAYQEKILSYILPNFSADMTVDELVYALMAREEGVKDANLKDYIAGKKVEISPEAFAHYKGAMLEKLKLSGLGLTGQEKISGIGLFDRLLGEVAQPYLTKYEKLIHLGTGLIFFIFVVAFWHLFYPLIYLFLWILYKLLLSSGFVKITKQRIEAEKAEI